jgi:hypothetical protein
MRKISLIMVILYSLVACSSSDDSADPGSGSSAPVSSNGSNQLVSSIPNLSSYSALALVSAKSTSSSSRLARSSAATDNSSLGNSCNVKALVGVSDDGEEVDLALTESEDCVGVTDMFDGKKYILLAAEGVYKNDQVCNIVFVQKSTGNLFCLGESQRSRYSFSRKAGSSGSSGSSGAMAGGSSWKKYDILQATENGNYIFLETTVDLFDDSGNKTSELIKIIRFDLTDPGGGPVASTVLKGENTDWYNWGNNSGDTSYFYIYGYAGLENGDLAASYQISLYNNTFNQWAYNNASTYYRYNPVTGKFETKEINLNSLSSSGYNWWDNIQCFLNSGSDGFYFVYNDYSNYGGGAALAKGTYNVNTSSVSVTQVGTTKLCSNWWGPSSTVKVGNKYYGIQQGNSSWQWDPNTGQYTGNISFEIFEREVTQASDVTIDNISINRNWADPTFLMSSDGSTGYVALGAYEEWKWDSNTQESTRNQFGAEIFKINISARNHSQILSSSQNIWISAISNIGSDGALYFSARDLTKPLFDKITVEIDNQGVLDIMPNEGNNKQTFSMVRL